MIILSLVRPLQLPFFVDELDLQLDPAHALKNALAKEQAANWVNALGPTQRQVFLGCSPEVQDLLGRMFDKDESTRASIDEILKHPWCQRELPAILQNKLNFLAAEQAKIDSESDRPRYSVEDGDKLVAHFVEKIYTDEYRALSKRGGGLQIVDRMMLTWSGLQHEEEGLPKGADGLEAVRFAAEWAEAQAQQLSSGNKRPTDTSTLDGKDKPLEIFAAAAADLGRQTRTGGGTGTHRAPTVPPSAESSLRSSLTAASGTWTPGSEGMPSAAAHAPYKSRARISTIITQKVVNEEGSVISAWTPHRRAKLLPQQ